MDNNVLNGGLLATYDNEWLIGDLGTGTTKYQDRPVGMFWYMNIVNDAVYSSDQLQGNAVCRFIPNTGISEIIIDHPVDVVYVRDDTLYYIHEQDRKLYRSSLDGRRSESIVHEPVGRYVFSDGRIVYTTERGVKSCDPSGRISEMICDASASALLMLGHVLAYADKRERHTVKLLDVRSGETRSLNNIASTMLNTDGTYVYCANRLHDRSIYRIEPDTGRSIRICGDSAQYVHIVDERICYYGAGKWYAMPLTGGPSVQL